MYTTVDIFEFVRSRRQAQGDLPIVRFSRAVADLPEQPVGDAGLVHWQADGVAGRHGESLLRLCVQAAPVVQCQRCLAPFAWPVDAEVFLRPVGTEAQLDEDAPLDENSDDEPEKVLGSQRFDLLEQVEDELILNIPYAPRHEICPDASAAGAGDVQDQPVVKKPSPFAALAKLKK